MDKVFMSDNLMWKWQPHIGNQLCWRQSCPNFFFNFGA